MGQYDQAIVLLRKNLKQSPDCHWLWFELSSAYYEKKKYKIALKYAQKALEIMPDCPLALWYCAAALSYSDIEGSYQKSYDIYKQLIKKGVAGLDRMDCCNEGHDYNTGFINDCRLCIGMCAYDMNKYKEAKRWTKLFIKKYDENSIYTKKFGERTLKGIEKKLGDV
jgi:tetratricopeptide (TPR) repeat protein